MNSAQGIVLKQIEYKDNDYILSIITEDDIISVYARGIKKSTSKNRAGVNYFTLSHFTFNDKLKNISLIKAERIKNYNHIFDSYDNMIILSFINEIILEIHHNSGGISGMYTNYIKVLECFDLGYEKNLIFSIYLVCLLNELGISINVNECGVCGQKNIVGIDIEVGGFVCKNHYTGPQYDLNFLRYFRIINNATFDNIDYFSDKYPIPDEFVTTLLSFLKRYSGIAYTKYRLINDVYSII